MAASTRNSRRVRSGVEVKSKALCPEPRSIRRVLRLSLAPKFIVGIATRKPSAEKNDQKIKPSSPPQSRHQPTSANNHVSLLKTIQPVARIVTGIDDPERARPDPRIG